MIKFAVALGVVIVVSLATLGFRVGIVVAAAVPLTLAAVFVIMLFTGRDFDRITLGALILSLGLLVDDAIIAIEMMVVKMEEGFDRIQAATFAWTSTASPMLFGTLVTIAGFLPVGFARSTAGEYAGNIFWVVAFSLITSWYVAVLFTPYLGVKLLPDIKPVAGGHDAIYATPNYQRFRGMVRKVVDHKWLAAGVTIALFILSVVGMGSVEKQFFPNSDRAELTVEVNLPPGSAFAATDRSVKNIEKTIMAEPEAGAVTSYIGQGMPRFILSLNTGTAQPGLCPDRRRYRWPGSTRCAQEKASRYHCPGCLPGSTRPGETIRLRPACNISGALSGSWDRTKTSCAGLPVMSGASWLKIRICVMCIWIGANGRQVCAWSSTRIVSVCSASPRKKPGCSYRRF